MKLKIIKSNTFKELEESFNNFIGLEKLPNGNAINRAPIDIKLEQLTDGIVLFVFYQEQDLKPNSGIINPKKPGLVIA